MLLKTSLRTESGCCRRGNHDDVAPLMVGHNRTPFPPCPLLSERCTLLLTPRDAQATLGFLHSAGQVKKRQPASEPPVTFLYLALSLYRDSFFVSHIACVYIYIHIYMYIYTFLLRALIPSLSLLLSLSLVTLPPSPHVATHDPPSLPQPPRPFPTSRHPNYATQHRGRRPTSSTSPPPTSSYSAPLLLLLPPLYPPAPSAARPQAQGNAGSLRIQTTEHEVTTRQI